jgi:hypothetical protein
MQWWKEIKQAAPMVSEKAIISQEVIIFAIHNNKTQQLCT